MVGNAHWFLLHNNKLQRESPMFSVSGDVDIDYVLVVDSGG